MFLYLGQGSKEFEVIRLTNRVSNSGRVLEEHQDTIFRFYGVITQASQTEIEQWRQSGHPISHKVVQPLPKDFAKAGDILKIAGDRYFYINGVRNPAELNHFCVYYCEERTDLNG